MSEFLNVSIIREANIYFGGGVTSRTVIFADGSKKTLGIMMPGEYDFGTGAPEVMEILSGKLTVKLPGSEEWVEVKGGESFNVAGDSRFVMKVTELSDYCCSFVG